MRERRVLFPQPEGPRRVKSSPSPIWSETWLTASRVPKRLVRSVIRICMPDGGFPLLRLLQLLPLGLDLGPILGLQALRPLVGDGIVVHVAHLALEVGPDAPGELHRHLGGRP